MSTSQRWSPDLGGREVANGRNSLVLTEEPLRRWKRMCAWEIDGDGSDGFPTEVLQLGSVVLLQCVKDRPCLRQVPLSAGGENPATAAGGVAWSSQTDVDVGGCDWPWRGFTASPSLKLSSTYCTFVCVCMRGGGRRRLRAKWEHAS